MASKNQKENRTLNNKKKQTVCRVSDKEAENNILREVLQAKKAEENILRQVSQTEQNTSTVVEPTSGVIVNTPNVCANPQLVTHSGETLPSSNNKTNSGSKGIQSMTTTAVPPTCIISKDNSGKVIKKVINVAGQRFTVLPYDKTHVVRNKTSTRSSSSPGNINDMPRSHTNISSLQRYLKCFGYS